MSAQRTKERFDALFAEARKADVAKVASVKLFKAGRWMRGACPICRSGEKLKRGGPFAVREEFWRCFADCDEGGDVVLLEQKLRGGTLVEAAQRLAGSSPAGTARASLQRPAEPRRAVEHRTASTFAARLWREAQPARGTLVERYLEARRIPRDLALEVLPRLRFHPRAYWGLDDDGGEISAPAMILGQAAPSGPIGGVHVTYLRADGAGKARLDPAKRMFGPQNAADGQPGGAWLIGPEGEGPLIVGEGVESTLSAVAIWMRGVPGGPVRAAAALSLSRLQGGWLPDRFGRYDPAAPKPDPESRAFTWPTPAAAPWDRVMVAVDRDMRPVKVKTRGPGGRSVQSVVDGDGRARICATLACAAWARTGVAASAIAPPAGMDFNDWLRSEDQ